MLLIKTAIKIGSMEVYIRNSDCKLDSFLGGLV